MGSSLNLCISGTPQAIFSWNNLYIQEVRRGICEVHLISDLQVHQNSWHESIQLWINKISHKKVSKNTNLRMFSLHILIVITSRKPYVLDLLNIFCELGSVHTAYLCFFLSLFNLDFFSSKKRDHRVASEASAYTQVHNE